MVEQISLFALYEIDHRLPLVVHPFCPNHRRNVSANAKRYRQKSGYL